MNDNILNDLDTAIVSLDHELRLCFINSAAESLLELSPRRALGMTIDKAILGTESLKTLLCDTLQTQQKYTQRRAEIATQSGKSVVVDLTVSYSSEAQWPRLLLEFHPMDRYLKIDRDAALHEHQEVTRSMIRGLAHEIKNPLGGIRGAAQLLHKEVDNPELEEYTNIIVEETDRLTALVDRLLAPKVIPKFARTNVHEILEKVRKLIELEARSKLTIIRDYDPSIPELKLDKEMMTQALLNIVRNAMQALEDTPDPQITLVTRTERQFTIASVRHRNVLKIDIIDNGPGVDASLREQLFFPMISGRPNGTGLGLSVAQSIIHQHQGFIEFENRENGTSFTITIPLEQNI
ncbi:MAG: nitrogen regulation protein NR(II) [Pseudomonadales bacterium]|jgi:two-component system nitrogen regulation sensor histidine kinase GlnL